MNYAAVLHWCSPKICSEVTAKLDEQCGVTYIYHFSDSHNNVFSWRFIVFAESSTNSAIFDFADSTEHTLHYFVNFQQLCETQW